MLRLHAFFHLNIMFSSIEENQRTNVIERCYWPILRLAERLNKPIGVEASGYTLETIEKLDPAWITTCRDLIARGLIEPIGSGYTQLIGPLMPADVVRWNLKLGHKTYDRLWGVRPRLALVNEQAYSAGVLPHYVEAGYDAILMDWDMCAHIHPEWPDEWRYHPQRAVGLDATLPVLWTSSIQFQKLQRLAHGDTELASYVADVCARSNGAPRTLAVYSNDAECFNFRPGRFGTEASMSHHNEWEIIEQAFGALMGDARVDWIAPSQALASAGANANNPVQLESPAFPIPVKKQLKYNASRWAVTGRASFELNRRCRSAARKLIAAESADEALWQRLCWLGSSDFRTHITEARFSQGLAELERLEAELARAAHEPVSIETSNVSVEVNSRAIDIVGPGISVRLNPRKGLAIERLSAGGDSQPIIGTIHHGEYDDLVHAFDWYSGTLISELVGRQRITDLAAVTPKIFKTPGRVAIEAAVETSAGVIHKHIESDGRSLHVRYNLDWPASERGSLRIANLTLLPNAIDAGSLYFETHNGGSASERFPLAGHAFEHGAPVSFLVSAASGAGMTEGSLTIGDANGTVTLTSDPDSDAYLALVTHRRVKDKIFCRVALSASELDETRKPWAGAPRPLSLGYRITVAR